jgi:hypothetical protein
MTFESSAVLGAADHIRVQLFRHHVSAPAIALLLDRDVKTIRRHLRGETPWPVEELWFLAEAMDVPFTEFTGLEMQP